MKNVLCVNGPLNLHSILMQWWLHSPGSLSITTAKVSFRNIEIFDIFLQGCTENVFLSKLPLLKERLKKPHSWGTRSTSSSCAYKPHSKILPRNKCFSKICLSWFPFSLLFCFCTALVYSRDLSFQYYRLYCSKLLVMFLICSCFVLKLPLNDSDI